MALDDLLAKLEGQAAVTPVTPCNLGGVTAEPLRHKACTPVTPVTPENGNNHDEAAIRRWIAQFDGRDPELIADIFERCHANADTMAYFVMRSAEVPKPWDDDDDRRCCNQCTNQYCTSYTPRSPAIAGGEQ